MNDVLGEKYTRHCSFRVAPLRKSAHPADSAILIYTSNYLLQTVKVLLDGL